MDVEEHLYRIATNIGITVITSSQVSVGIYHTLSCWQLPTQFLSLFLTCEVHVTETFFLILNLQRPALIPFHSLELKLIDGEGKWELCAIHQ